jgi:hypothetical protein
VTEHLKLDRMSSGLRRTGRRLAAAALIAVAVSLSFVGGAEGDGDPASDVLVSQPAFIGEGVGGALKPQLELVKLLDVAAAHGFRIRVALIGSASDLGSVTPLWKDPGEYASYLWEELREAVGGQVLVVMPNGYGLHGPSRGPYRVPAAERQVTAPLPGQGNQMLAAAMVAIRRLAAADKHTLPSVSGVALPMAPADRDRWQVWLVLVAGAALIGACWGASFRARPPGVGSGVCGSRRTLRA